MITLKVPKTAKRMLQIFLAVSFISGGLFFILNTWVMVEGEYGPEKHPAQFTSLKIHAISAFSIMVLYGAFWGSHVFLGWRTQRSRNTGIGLTTMIGVQVITAYLLYYVASELYREIAMWTHLGIGLSLPIWLILHIRAAKKGKPAAKPRAVKKDKPRSSKPRAAEKDKSRSSKPRAAEKDKSRSSKPRASEKDKSRSSRPRAAEKDKSRSSKPRASEKDKSRAAKPRAAEKDKPA